MSSTNEEVISSILEQGKIEEVIAVLKTWNKELSNQTSDLFQYA